MITVKKISARMFSWRTEFGSGVSPSKRQAEKAAEASIFYGNVELNQQQGCAPMPTHIRERIKTIFKGETT
jgi:hypothetical protein